MAGCSWGGSEELWSRSALQLAAEGFDVAASVLEWTPVHPRLEELRARGITVRPRPPWFSWRKHTLRRLMSRDVSATVFEVHRLAAEATPCLVVFSDGGSLPPVELLEFCIARHLPFVTVGHGSTDYWWPGDAVAERYRIACAAALRCFFVARAARRMTEKQIGGALANAEVVWNPVNVAVDAPLPWPELGRRGELHFACVGSLHPEWKGQDIILEVLAKQPWASRSWRLAIYGEGPSRHTLEALARSLNLVERVIFAGFASVEEIWAVNHVLVMPSRSEGLPLALVEAMLCGRPVIATNVGGHAEVVEDGITGFLADAPSVGSMDRALERFWARRTDAEDIGKAAARSIRQLVPQEPARIFAQKLAQLIL